MTRKKIAATISLLAAGAFLTAVDTAGAYYVDPSKYGSPVGEVCIGCHKEATPGIYQQWKESAMGQTGVNCYDCHRAEEGDPDAFEHKELIAIVVSPKDCARCHEKEFKEFESSLHADAAANMHKVSMQAAEKAWGDKNKDTGCIGCHGSTLKVGEGGMLDPATWPNTGIGRINPDKSRGACTACHTRHIFSKEQARRPETCGRCHTGAEHPQKQIYAGSKHGIMYQAFRDDMNMDKRRWLAGLDYFQGPTCVSCHMGAMPPQMDVKNADERIDMALRSALKGDEKEFQALLAPTRVNERDFGATHNVSERMSWDLRAPIATKREDWQNKRETMQGVCRQCHGEHFVQQQFMQFDTLVERYNEKYAKPATRMREALMKDGKLTKADYDDKLDLIYWDIINNWGRNAKNGAAMMNPEYAWQTGMRQMAERFEEEFIPELENILGRRTESFLREHGYATSHH